MTGNGLFTPGFCKEIFDECFKRTYNVEFIFNTDMSQFRKAYKSGKLEKPILLIYWSEFIMSHYVDEFQKALSEYNDHFDIYFCSDEAEFKKTFDS